MSTIISEEYCGVAPTHKDVLLERWAKDTETMADDMVGSYYDASRGTFFLPDGSVEYNFEKAVDNLIAYLNSAAEVGK